MLSATTCTGRVSNLTSCMQALTLLTALLSQRCAMSADGILTPARLQCRKQQTVSAGDSCTHVRSYFEVAPTRSRGKSRIKPTEQVDLHSLQVKEEDPANVPSDAFTSNGRHSSLPAVHHRGMHVELPIEQAQAVVGKCGHDAFIFTS